MTPKQVSQVVMTYKTTIISVAILMVFSIVFVPVSDGMHSTIHESILSVCTLLVSSLSSHTGVAQLHVFLSIIVCFLTAV